MKLPKWFTLPGIPSDALTSERVGVRRVAVDPQQTSFEDNTQFRFFNRLQNIDYNSQIVYKLTITKPVNILVRNLLVWAGGREYLVYKDNPLIVFTGTLVNAETPETAPLNTLAGSITRLNENLNDSIDSHIAPSVTIQRAVGSGIFTKASNQIARAGAAAASASNTVNRPASEYSPNDLRSGLAPQVLWLVLENIGGNTNTSGQYELVWEQR